MASSPFWISVFYFGEFVNEDGKWEWKSSGSNDGVVGVPITSDMSYEELYSQVQNLCNIDSSLHDIEMRFLHPGSGQFHIPIQITSSRHLQWLLGLNKQGQCLPICVSLVNKDPVEHLDEFEIDNHISYEVEVENDAALEGMQQESGDHNCEVQENDDNEIDQVVDWNELEISPDTNIGFPTQNFNSEVFPTPREEFVQHNEDEITREHQVVSSSNGAISRAIPMEFDLRKGLVYTSKSRLKLVLHLLALTYNFEFKVKKSTPELYVVVCIDENCKWRLRATKFNQCSYFQIRRYESEHTCSLTVIRNDHRQARSRIIGEHIMHKFLDPNTIYTPADIIRDIHQEFGIQMNYQKARRCKEVALECLRGSYEDSYAKLKAYAHNLALSNPGTVYHLETDNESHFMYFFLALGPCIHGFHSSMRPVVVVDGTFLATKYKGTLIVATCQDANMQIYPLAWGIVDSENDDSWYWFFMKLKELTGDREDLVIISDRHPSLINGVRDAYQNAHHGHCIYHIKGNLRTKTRKADTYSLFMKAAKAYTIEEFENFMGQIESTDMDGWTYLKTAPYKTWARSYFQGNRYNIMTSNNAESLNSLFRKERQGPILTLIERIGSKLQKWFQERREKAQNCTSRLTPAMEEKMRKSLEKAKSFTAQPIDQMRYTVRHRTLNFIVNFEEGTCTCRKFQLDHFPCEHAIAATRQRGYSAYLLCSDYYTVDFWRAAYAGMILPAPNETEWEITEEIKETKVLPPSVKKQVGRRKTKRAQSTGEFTKRNKCSRCGVDGHNRLTCRDRTPMVDRQSQN